MWFNNLFHRKIARVSWNFIAVGRLTDPPITKKPVGCRPPDLFWAFWNKLLNESNVIYMLRLIHVTLYVHSTVVLMHYSDVIMGAVAFHKLPASRWFIQSNVYSGADKRKHQSYASLTFVRGIRRWPVISPHKWQMVTRKMFPFDDVIMGCWCWNIFIQPQLEHSFLQQYVPSCGMALCQNFAMLYVTTMMMTKIFLIDTP